MTTKSKIGSLFSGWFEEEKNTEEPEAVGESQENDEHVGNRRPLSLGGISDSVGSNPPSFAAIGSQNEYDPEYERVVVEAIEAANVPGIDYAEYRNVVSKNIKKGGTEADAFTDAFETLSIADKTLTVEKLMSSSSTYIGVAEKVQNDLNGECAEFMRVSEQELTSLLKDIDKLLGTIKNQAAIEELKRVNAEVVTRHVQLVRAHQEKRMAKMQFVVSRITGEIQKDQHRIETILGNKP